MSAAYRNGIEETVLSAELVYDPFRVTALEPGAVDEMRRREAREGDDWAKAALKGAMYLFRKRSGQT
jgi:hypothetical protein